MSQSEVQTIKSEEDMSVDTTDLSTVDSIATDTEELVLHHDECSQTHLFEALLLSTPVSLLIIDTKYVYFSHIFACMNASLFKL